MTNDAPPTVDDLRREIADCDEQIRYWKDRADKSEGFGKIGTRGLTPQRARHNQEGYEVRRLALIEGLKELGFEYDGPPTEVYQFDVTETELHGRVQVHATTSSPRCVHWVEATSMVEGRQAVINDHIERCMHDRRKGA